MNITEPLRLAVGSHKAGSGKGCAMNVVSWENGDKTITDLPACADPMLARIVQNINDSICTHRTGDLLCPSCSVKVLDLAHRTAGTSDHGLAPSELHRLYVRIAVKQAQSVAHLNTDPRVQAAIGAALTWLQDPTAANANANAAYAADAANAAIHAAYANAADAADAADAANAAYAANAMHAAYAAIHAADAAIHAAALRLDMAHKVIDQFIELAGITPTRIDDDTLNAALRAMAVVS